MQIYQQERNIYKASLFSMDSRTILTFTKTEINSSLALNERTNAARSGSNAWSL
jgi:hypothetical protein